MTEVERAGHGRGRRPRSRRPSPWPGPPRPSAVDRDDGRRGHRGHPDRSRRRPSRSATSPPPKATTSRTRSRTTRLRSKPPWPRSRPPTGRPDGRRDRDGRRRADRGRRATIRGLPRWAWRPISTPPRPKRRRPPRIRRDDEIPTIGDDALAARLAGLVPEGSPAPAPRAATPKAAATSQVVVTGLVSVASIASFKRHLGRVSGRPVGRRLVRSRRGVRVQGRARGGCRPGRCDPDACPASRPA